MIYEFELMQHFWKFELQSSKFKEKEFIHKQKHVENWTFQNSDRLPDRWNRQYWSPIVILYNVYQY